MPHCTYFTHRCGGGGLWVGFGAKFRRLECRCESDNLYVLAFPKGYPPPPPPPPEPDPRPLPQTNTNMKSHPLCENYPRKNYPLVAARLFEGLKSKMLDPEVAGLTQRKSIHRSPEITKIAHRDSLAIFTPRTRVSQGLSAVGISFFLSQRKSPVASDFWSQGDRVSSGLKNHAMLQGRGRNHRRNRRESRDFGALVHSAGHPYLIYKHLEVPNLLK